MALVPLIEDHVVGGDEVAELDWRIRARVILIPDPRGSCPHLLRELARFASRMDREMSQVVLLRRPLKGPRRTRRGGVSHHPDGRRESTLACGALFTHDVVDEHVGDHVAELKGVWLRELRAPYHWIALPGRLHWRWPKSAYFCGSPLFLTFWLIGAFSVLPMILQ